MKKVFELFIGLSFSSTCLFGQNDPYWNTNGNAPDTNTFIGTTNSRALKIYSNNTEYMRLSTTGHLGLGLKNPVERIDLIGNIRLSGDVIFTKYIDRLRTEEVYLVLDENGRTRTTTRNGFLQDALASDCFKTGKYGEPIADSPTWASATGPNYGKLFTGSRCPAWVGIGTNDPLAHLHIRSQNNQQGLKLFLVEGHLGATSSRSPIFQITNNGITRAREIIVDLETWPDYVFRPSYSLMPLQDLRSYINTYGHLPNVPAAQEIENGGLSLNENARITLEKIEELTLYVLDLQEQLDKQQDLIDQQFELIRKLTIELRK